MQFRIGMYQVEKCKVLNFRKTEHKSPCKERFWSVLLNSQEPVDYEDNERIEIHKRMYLL